VSKTDFRDALRTALYLRVSTQEQADHGWNLGADQERGIAMCAEQGWQTPVIFNDAALQGDDPSRPGLLKLLAELHRYDVLIMRQQDRISRDPVIWGTVAAACQKAGVRVHTFTGPIDLDTPQGRFFADMMAAVAKLEKGQIAQRVAQMKVARAEAGGRPGGNRPFGYLLADTGRRGKRDKEIHELRPDPVERLVVERMFKMARAVSQRRIAAILNAEGLRSANGALWTQATVQIVLGNQLYIGKVRRGVYAVKTVKGKPKRVRVGWELYDGQHDPIVDEDLWLDVNRKRADPVRRAGGRPTNTRHLLTRGLLRCGSCGSAMHPVVKPGRPDVYECLGRRNHCPAHCQQPQIHRELIDRAIVTEVSRRYLDLDGARDRLRAAQEFELPLAETAVADAEQELAAAEARIAKVTRGWQNDVIDDAEYARQRSALEEELAAGRAQVEQARARVEQIRARTVISDAEEELLRHLADLRALVSDTVEEARDPESMRAVLRELFESVRLVKCPAPIVFIPEGAAQDAAMIEDGETAYALLPVSRWQMVGPEDLEPIKAAVPGLDEKPNAPTCRGG
jgi:site-specific DNA recombinase